LHFRDIYYLIRILCKHQGTKEVDLQFEEETPYDIKEKVYNETRSTVIALYRRLHRHLNQQTELSQSDELSELLEDA
jgi:hypothetical protein